MMMAITVQGAVSSREGNDYLDKVVSSYHPIGASIALIEDGEIKEVRNYGYMNKENQMPVTDETRFKIASISKAVTAYGVMQLVDQKVLDLDKSVNEYLTRYKIVDKHFDGNKVTLRMLLSHTSGIRGDVEKIYEGIKPDVATALSDLNLYIATEPGSKFAYSEFIGLGICQLIVEEVTGQKFEDYMVEKVFEPLDMQMTDYAEEDNEKGKLATPYAGLKKAVKVTPIVLNGAGGVTATSTDLAKFGIGLMKYYKTGNREMFKPQRNTLSKSGEYGLGIIPRKLSDGRVVYEHNGTLTGWNAQLVIEPESGKGIAVVSNSDLAYYMTYDLMAQWTQHALGERVEDPQIKHMKSAFSRIAIILGVMIGLMALYYGISYKQKRLGWQYSKIKTGVMAVVFMIGIILVYFICYMDQVFNILFKLENYYLFTFFPPSFNWIIVEVGIIYLLIVLRMNLCKIEKEK